MARFPENVQEQDHFELYIDGVDFLNYYFVSLKDENSKSLRGIIILNGSVFLDESQEFEWNVKTAENRMTKKLGQDRKIDTLILRNIDCSSVVI